MDVTLPAQIEDVLSRLQQVKPTGLSKWQSLCPAHEDHTPSLSITLAQDGKILFKCFAGCTFESICAALGLQTSELFPDSQHQAAGPAKPLAVYDYKDEWGKLIYQVVRMPPKRFMQRRPGGNGEFIWDMKGITRLPYRLPELLKTGDGDVIFITEGERDVLTLVNLGLIATTNSGGASKWLDSYNHYFKGRTVAILGDNDEPGRKHVRQVAQALLPVAKEVRMVSLPEGFKDISEYLDTQDSVEPEALKSLLLKWFNEAKPLSKEQKSAMSETQTVTDHLSDAGNGSRFAAQHGYRLRYCYNWERWLFFDGQKWNDKVAKEITSKLAIETALSIAKEAEKENDHDKRWEILKWSHKSESSYLRAAMLASAHHVKPIPAYADQFDTNPWLLNVLNGTINLKTGRLQPHNPVDMITKLASVCYDPKAECPLWFGCLDTWMDGNAEKIDYLQRLGGYCLTGDVAARIFPIFYGSGKNGKSVFCNTLIGLMGDYGIIAPQDFLTEKYTDEHPTEIADLFGARLAIAQETRTGMRLRTSLVKAMTGERRLKARFMRQDYFDFAITHKIILTTNNKPIIEDTSNAIWDRTALVDWPVRIPDDKVDTYLLDKLNAERPSILNWLLEGCRKLQAENYKLTPPESVRTATQIYRDESDPLTDFITECCIIEPNTITRTANLRKAYDVWAQANNVRFTLSTRRFNEMLRQSGYKYIDSRQFGNIYKCWQGIGLRSETSSVLPMLPQYPDPQL